MDLKELQDLIDKADNAYYTTGNSIVEDVYYDRIKEELRQLNPTDIRLQTVGATINSRDSILEKRKHTIPMGSLSKCMNESEWKSWLQNTLYKNGLTTTELLHASLKMDGGSFSLYYKNGTLTEAVSRGDSFEGEDITANAVKFQGLVTNNVKVNGKPFSGYIRGEVVLTLDDWKSIDPNQLSNPRNLAVGISRRKSGEQSECLTFYAFRIFDEDGTPLGKTEKEMSEFLNKMNFFTVSSFVGTADEVWKWYLKIGKARNTLCFWIDGIVVKLNDIEKQLKFGESSNCPKAMTAIKFAAEGAITKLLNVTLQVGNSGVICPVANLQPVKVGGVEISNASLCNWDNIEMLDIAIGDSAEVVRAGDVIPRIINVTERPENRVLIPIPTNCPVCNSVLERKENIGGAESSAIYCVNQQCPSIITGRIDKYLSSLNILGVGTSLIESLVRDLNVKTPADLYLLNTKRSELSNLVLSGKVRFGEKRADKFLEEIENKRNLSLSDFLGSLLIFGLGKRRVSLIQESASNNLDKLEDWFGDYLVKNAAQCGVVNIAQRIHDEIVSQRDYILSFINNGVNIILPQPKVEKKDGAKLFCITGTLSQGKKVFHEMIEKSGNLWTDDYSKSVDFLVAADPSSGSNKLKKAEKNGTKIISEAELLKMINS